jgi:hypothetical protein
MVDEAGRQATALVELKPFQGEKEYIYIYIAI